MQDIKILRRKKKRLNRLKKEALYANQTDDTELEENNNIKIFDYNTKHFDICPKARSAMNSLVSDIDDNEDAEEIAEEIAESTDELFEIEKQDSISGNDLKDAYDAFYEASYRVGQLEILMEKSYLSEFEFLPEHLKTIVEKSNPNK